MPGHRSESLDYAKQKHKRVDKVSACLNRITASSEHYANGPQLERL